MIFRYLLLILGVWSCSTAAILIKLSTIEPVYLASIRLLLASLLLLPLHLHARKRYPGQAPKLRTVLLPAVFLAMHFVLWIVAARMIPAANGALIANLVPLVMPIALWLMVSEKPKSRELFATVIAMTGVGVMVSYDLFESGSLLEALTEQRSYLRGDLLAFSAMCMLTVYLVLAKRNKAVPSIWLYIVPVYAVAGVMCLPLAVMLHGSPPRLDLEQTGLLLALVILPTVMGHTLLNIAMWWFRGQVVSIFNLFQFTFTGVMAYLILDGEMPTNALYVAAATVVTAVVILVWSKKEKTLEPTDCTKPIMATQES
ncbi:MAG: hypothetical protein CMJ19_19790 [Phycisphaeraceae bacterium]|nr:hypothetical protein [Phycisphaeraceae bacterium]